MKARTRQLDALPETSEEHENRPYVPNILEEDEISKSTWTGEQRTTSTNHRMKALKKMSWRRKMQ